MANFLTYYKKHNSNLYSLVVSLLLALWYNGISGILNHYYPQRGPILSIIFMVIPLIVFLTDDGRLNELYEPPSIEYPIGQKVDIAIPAIISSSNPSTKEKFRN